MEQVERISQQRSKPKTQPIEVSRLALPKIFEFTSQKHFCSRQGEPASEFKSEQKRQQHKTQSHIKGQERISKITKIEPNSRPAIKEASVIIMLIDQHPQELREQPILKQELHQFPILQTPIQQLLVNHERKRQQEKQDEFQSGAQ